MLCALPMGGMACEIPIPDNVFSCRESADCPDRFVCQNQRCRASTQGPLAGTGSIGSPNKGMPAGSDAAAGSDGAEGEESAGGQLEQLAHEVLPLACLIAADAARVQGEAEDSRSIASV